MKITQELLDEIGFGEYQSGCGDFGERRLFIDGIGCYTIGFYDDYSRYYTLHRQKSFHPILGEYYKTDSVDVITIEDIVKDMKEKSPEFQDYILKLKTHHVQSELIHDQPQ